MNYSQLIEEIKKLDCKIDKGVVVRGSCGDRSWEQWLTPSGVPFFLFSNTKGEKLGIYLFLWLSSIIFLSQQVYPWKS